MCRLRSYALENTKEQSVVDSVLDTNVWIGHLCDFLAFESSFLRSIYATPVRMSIALGLGVSVVVGVSVFSFLVSVSSVAE